MTQRRRNTLRLQSWDYTTPGAYFVTLCTHQREYLFDNQLWHETTEHAWQYIPQHPHAAHVLLDEWIVMPNHLHGILFLTEQDKVSVSDKTITPDKVKPGSIGAIVGNFKSLVTRRINNLRCTTSHKVWQRGYYERIIRNEEELNAIRRYVEDNPRRWAEDRDNLDALFAKMRLVE